MYLHYIDKKHLRYTNTTHSRTHNYIDKYITGYTYLTYKRHVYSILSVSNINSNNVR